MRIYDKDRIFLDTQTRPRPHWMLYQPVLDHVVIQVLFGFVGVQGNAELSDPFANRTSWIDSKDYQAIEHRHDVESRKATSSSPGSQYIHFVLLDPRR